MPSNIEIKARVSDPQRMLSLVEVLCGAPGTVIEQRDTFFPCPNGRLKLREFAHGTGELIFYRRPDMAGVKQSDYAIAPISDPSHLLAVLSAALGVGQLVAKTRVLFLVGQTRIHVDLVAGLGTFVELEVVLREGQPPEEGHRIAHDLMRALEIRQADLVEGAYADLLSRRPA